MSDLFEPLRGHDAHDPYDAVEPGLSPADVRRRGDRLRRRRTVVTVAGSAAAVAAIALGATLVGNGTSLRGDAPPAGRPTPTVVEQGARIPDSFPLATGISATTGDSDFTVRGPGRDIPFVAELQVCNASYSPADRAVDRLTFTSTGPEFFEGRDLSLYADAATASAAARDLATKFADCPRYSTDSGTTAVVTRTAANQPGDLGDESWIVKRGYEVDGQPTLGEEVLVIARTGTAVLVTRTADEGSGLMDEKAFDESVKRDLLGVRPVVAAMCTFSSEGCDASTPAATLLDENGLGDLRLYLTDEEVADTGLATVEGPSGATGQGCRPVHYTGRPDGEVDGFLDDFGVVVLFAPAGVTTPEGLAVGSPAADVEKLYPGAEQIAAGYRIPLPGAKQYVATIDGDTVSQLSLESSDQTCTR